MTDSAGQPSFPSIVAHSIISCQRLSGQNVRFDLCTGCVRWFCVVMVGGAGHRARIVLAVRGVAKSGSRSVVLRPSQVFGCVCADRQWASTLPALDPADYYQSEDSVSASRLVLLNRDHHRPGHFPHIRLHARRRPDLISRDVTARASQLRHHRTPLFFLSLPSPTSFPSFSHGCCSPSC